MHERPRDGKYPPANTSVFFLHLQYHSHFCSWSPETRGSLPRGEEPVDRRSHLWGNRGVLGLAVELWSSVWIFRSRQLQTPMFIITCLLAKLTSRDSTPVGSQHSRTSSRQQVKHQRLWILIWRSQRRGAKMWYLTRAQDSWRGWGTRRQQKQLLNHLAFSVPSSWGALRPAGYAPKSWRFGEDTELRTYMTGRNFTDPRHFLKTGKKF